MGKIWYDQKHVAAQNSSHHLFFSICFRQNSGLSSNGGMLAIYCIRASNGVRTMIELLFGWLFSLWPQLCSLWVIYIIAPGKCIPNSTELNSKSIITLHFSYRGFCDAELSVHTRQIQMADQRLQHVRGHQCYLPSLRQHIWHIRFEPNASSTWNYYRCHRLLQCNGWIHCVWPSNTVMAALFGSVSQ